MQEKIKLNSIDEAIEAIRQGEIIIVVDDEDRENEGDFITSAELITPEKVNFMITVGRGVLCAPITEERCLELELDKQVANNTSILGTPFTVTVDKLEGCTTGVSSHDRAETIKALADPNTKPEDLGRPGHISPLYAKNKGVLRRAGHTEASIDLCRLAGLRPAAALIEIMNEDGSMARLPELYKLAQKHKLKLIAIKDLIAYRLKQESLVEMGQSVRCHQIWIFQIDSLQANCYRSGTYCSDQGRMEQRRSCIGQGTLFLPYGRRTGSMRCECGEQLHKAMEIIEKEGKGVVVYMNQEGRGID